MSTDKSKKEKPKSNEEIVAHFQNLRQAQRTLIGKLQELEMDLTEHKLVIETLQDVDKSRKCFRMVGGVLIERNVGEILPSLVENRNQLTNAIDALKNQVTQKGQEINEYKENNNIRVKGVDDVPQEKKEAPASQGVLVQGKA